MNIVDQGQWLAIPGLEGRYEASASGEIKSLNRIVVGNRPNQINGRRLSGTVLRQSVNRGGYPVVSISGRSRTVHRLIVMAFIGLIPEGMEVNHKNGIKTDNSIDNLEIVTPSENTLHAVVLGLHVPPRGVINGNAKLNDSKVQMILADPNKSCNSFSKELGVSPTLISAIRKRKLWKHIHDNDYGGGARVDGLEPSA